jgi:hypothetical protein
MKNLRIKQNYIFPLLILLMGSQACRNKSANTLLPAEPVIKPVENQITIKRYEKALFALDKNQLKQQMALLNPEFTFFLGNQWQDTMNILRIYNFLNDPNVRELYDITVQKYPDVDFLEKGLTDAFGIYLQAYPEKKRPQVFTYVSGLDVENPVYFFDTAMAIGLDLFLGKDVEAYVKAGIPKYKINRFTPDNIMPICMMAVSDNVIKVDQNRNTLLDQMILAGKELYFLDITLPDVKDEFKIGYTQEQIQWCRINESNIWAFIIEHELLFSSDSQGITKLMTDAPYTSGFDTKSPGRLGAYLGWQIVRAYMEEAGNISLKQLMEDTDARNILKVSQFKPGKNQ